MASKAVTLAFTVVIVAVLVFLIWWFLNTRKQTEQIQNHVSPLSRIENDVSHFVSNVKNGFTKVLSAGEKYAGKFLGLGEKELSNTIGFIEHGVSNVEKGTESFVKDVYNTIGLGGIIKGLPNVEKTFAQVPKDIKKIFSPIERPILSGFEKFEKGGANVEKQVVSDIEKGIKGLEHFGHENVGKIGHIILPPVENIPREVYGGVEHIGTNIEKGVEGFVNDIKNTVKKVLGVTNACR